MLVLGLGMAVGMPGRRWGPLVYVPAVISVLPRVPFILGEDGRRVEHREQVIDTVFKVGGWASARPRC